MCHLFMDTMWTAELRLRAMESSVVGLQRRGAMSYYRTYTHGGLEAVRSPYLFLHVICCI